MDWAQIIQLLVTLFSAAAAILAWIAKLKWSQEYTAAKEAEIKAKEAMIATLKEQIEFWKSRTPPEMIKFHESAVAELQKIIKKLNDQLEEAKKKLAEKEQKLATGRKSGGSSLQPLVQAIRDQELQLESVSSGSLYPIANASVTLKEALAGSAKLSELLGVKKVQLPKDLNLSGIPVTLTETASFMAKAAPGRGKK